MITESKVIELFCMADDFCKFFDAMMAKYTLKRLFRHTKCHHQLGLATRVATRRVGHVL
ncbi:putative uncharacterized protein [Prevotella sp. CAG:924]|nr:putative uncharacterized protein [Prevotella sp. CAG:924]